MSSGEADKLVLQDVNQVFVTADRGGATGVLAVQDVNLEIRPGEFVTFIGPSGCGKSTVLNMLAGLITPTHGTISQGGSDIHGVNTRVGYMTQEDNLLPWRTLRRNVEMPLELANVPKAERRDRAQEWLDRVGLSRFGDAYPHELSGGMRKRGSLVRTLVADDPVILMDEPFGPLDAQNRLLLQDLLLTLWREQGKTIVFVTHDLVEAVALSDRIVIFTSSPGRIRSVHEVPLPRPRDVFHIHDADGFTAIYDRIWTELREEIEKTTAAQEQAQP